METQNRNKLVYIQLACMHACHTLIEYINVPVQICKLETLNNCFRVIIYHGTYMVDVIKFESIEI